MSTVISSASASAIADRQTARAIAGNVEIKTDVPIPRIPFDEAKLERLISGAAGSAAPLCDAGLTVYATPGRHIVGVVAYLQATGKAIGYEGFELGVALVTERIEATYLAVGRFNGPDCVRAHFFVANLATLGFDEDVALAVPYGRSGEIFARTMYLDRANATSVIRPGSADYLKTLIPANIRGTNGRCKMKPDALTASLVKHYDEAASVHGTDAYPPIKPRGAGGKTADDSTDATDADDSTDATDSTDADDSTDATPVKYSAEWGRKIISRIIKAKKIDGESWRIADKLALLAILRDDSAEAIETVKAKASAAKAKASAAKEAKAQAKAKADAANEKAGRAKLDADRQTAVDIANAALPAAREAIAAQTAADAQAIANQADRDARLAVLTSDPAVAAKIDAELDALELANDQAIEGATRQDVPTSKRKARRNAKRAALASVLPQASV